MKKVINERLYDQHKGTGAGVDHGNLPEIFVTERKFCIA